MLEILSEETTALSIGEISARMGVHRSIAYRILRTLEDHGLVARDSSGGIVLGTGLATLARGVARDLQTAALPELTSLANELGATAFLVVLDRGDCTTLDRVEPRHSRAAVVQRPGTRHALNVGAPGLAIQAILGRFAVGGDFSRPAPPSRGVSVRSAKRDSPSPAHEVLPGVTGVAVPLKPTQGLQPAAIAVVYPSAQLAPDQVGSSSPRSSPADQRAAPLASDASRRGAKQGCEERSEFSRRRQGQTFATYWSGPHHHHGAAAVDAAQLEDVRRGIGAVDLLMVGQLERANLRLEHGRDGTDVDAGVVLLVDHLHVEPGIRGLPPPGWRPAVIPARRPATRRSQWSARAAAVPGTAASAKT